MYVRYDCKAGFWGVEGGPCLGILPVSVTQRTFCLSPFYCLCVHVLEIVS